MVNQINTEYQSELASELDLEETKVDEVALQGFAEQFLDR
jgi:hypothetical protein